MSKDHLRKTYDNAGGASLEVVDTPEGTFPVSYKTDFISVDGKLKAIKTKCVKIGGVEYPVRTENDNNISREFVEIPPKEVRELYRSLERQQKEEK